MSARRPGAGRRGSVFGYEIVSDLPLTRVPPHAGPRGQVEISLRGAGPLADGTTLLHRHEDAGVVFTLERAGATLLAHCSATGDYAIDADAGRILVAPAGPPGAVEHRVLSMALPLLAAERGDVALHAAGLAVGRRAVAFVGPAGRGKSTLARAAIELGASLLGEDGVVVSLDAIAIAWPGPLGIRLADGLVATAPEQHAPGPLPLAALVVLAERTEVGSSPARMEAIAAVPSLVPALIFAGSGALASAFAQAADLAERVPVYRVSMPDDLDSLPGALERTLDAILE